MKTADFDYQLPPERIAQHPPAERDAARMLVLDPIADRLIDSAVRKLPRFLEPGDLLVLNDSRVLPARLLGRRDDGGEAEVLLLRSLNGKSDRWEALTRPSRRLPAGSRIRFHDSVLGASIEEQRAGTAVIHLDGPTDPLEEVRRIGEMPTPPYIKEHLTDQERYQTVYSREEGSAAAPTAGLHFTPRLLNAIRDRGVQTAFVTLHVGRGGRVVAVGTTCVRVLESAAEGNGVRAGTAWTSLLILPGHRFRVVDGMLTNFHLPKSTLLMLVSAFAGRDRVLHAYQYAIQAGYRFYSFGDCMFITGPQPGGGRE
ncbi:MAG: S-adenosylmethionine:tRNA ribosyltransferase-isomerase [Chloroflexi bacterium]|nr:MAG: S-adenosylmethionine:tRNA ribosyltransferase-isomerase [Chloroflexota bacterium]